MAIFKVIKRNWAIVDGRENENKYDILDTPHDNVTQSSDALLVKLGEKMFEIYCRNQALEANRSKEISGCASLKQTDRAKAHQIIQ